MVREIIIYLALVVIVYATAKILNYLDEKEYKRKRGK